MKSLQLFLVLMVFGASSSLSYAEIYKWKDKNGAIRYTDTPPPSNIKQEALRGKKAVQATGQAPSALVETTKPAIAKEGKKEGTSKEEDAARKRQADAEADKKAKQAKEKQELAQAENCKLARANLATFNNGGRITKTDESGERIFLSDKDIEKGKAQGQEDVNKYCI